MSAVVDFPVKPETRPYLETFGRARHGGDPEWLAGYRNRGLARFAELGFPSRRSEAWRYLDLHRLEQRPMLPVGRESPVITSAGALVDELKLAGVRSISVITPYMPALTDLVVAYIRNEGIAVIDSIALSIPDNLAVGRRDPENLLTDIQRLNTKGADAVVVSACVQMPSLPVIPRVEDRIANVGVDVSVQLVGARFGEDLDTSVA